MNAIPERAHNYERARVPKTPPKEYTRAFAKVEYLDELRKRRVAEQRSGRQEVYAHGVRSQQPRAKQASKARQAGGYVEQRYERQRPQAQHVGERQRPNGRKLTAAYEVSAPRKEPDVYYDRVMQRPRQQRPAQQHTMPRQQPRQPVYVERGGTPRQQRPSSYMQQRQPAYAQPRQSSYVQQRPAARPQPKRAAIVGYDMIIEPRRRTVGSRRDRQAAIARQPVVAKAPRKKGVVSTIVIIMMVFGILVGILSAYAKLSSMTYQNAGIEKNIAELERQIDQKEMDIALKENLNDIRQRASVLGLRPAKDDQTVAVVLEDEIAVPAEQTVLPAENEASEQDGVAGFFSNLGDSIKGWFDGLGS